MKNEILLNLSEPSQLERLYRSNRSGFRQAFNDLYPELEDSKLVAFWDPRLNFTKDEISFGHRKDLVVVVICCIIAGLIAKLPAILQIDQELFYQRNIGFIVFPVLSAFFAWKNKLSPVKILMMAGVWVAAMIFINWLPENAKSDTLDLSCMHMVLFLWSVLGVSFVGGLHNNDEKRLGFLRYNGDLVVISTLLVIAGAILTGITIGLFELIGYNIERFYFENIAVFGLPAIPIIGTYLTRTNPQLISKVSPMIARIFSPLVLVMLAIYLVAMTYSGRDPYNDREFLMIFNAMLIGVIALIFFSVAEISKSAKGTWEVWVLFLLSVVTVVVNGIALSAILFRIMEWGITPNRLAVLGGNVLMLINLVLVTVQLYKVLNKKDDIDGVGKTISYYLPVYSLWTIVVTFLFPLIFGNR